MAVKRSIIERLTSQLVAQGQSIGSAKAIAISQLRKNGSIKKDGSLTEKGKKRQALGAAGRAKDRAAKAAGRSPSEYKYNPRTNRATLKKK